MASEVKVYQAVNFYKINFQINKSQDNIECDDSYYNRSYTISEIVEVEPHCRLGASASVKKHIGFCIGDFNYQHIHDSLKQIFPTLRETIDFLVKRDNA